MRTNGDEIGMTWQNRAGQINIMRSLCISTKTFKANVKLRKYAPYLEHLDTVNSNIYQSFKYFFSIRSDS